MVLQYTSDGVLSTRLLLFFFYTVAASLWQYLKGIEVNKLIKFIEQEQALTKKGQLNTLPRA